MKQPRLLAAQDLKVASLAAFNKVTENRPEMKIKWPLPGLPWNCNPKASKTTKGYENIQPDSSIRSIWRN